MTTAQPDYVPKHIWYLARVAHPEAHAVWLTQSEAGVWMAWHVLADPIADRHAGYWQTTSADDGPQYLGRSDRATDWPTRKILIERRV